jgi:DNA-directed RNA polymerase subunit RPC12/RpoP
MDQAKSSFPSPHYQSVKIVQAVEQTVMPKYKCKDCDHVMTSEDTKKDIKCNNCRGRILIKLRTSGGIEYSAR